MIWEPNDWESLLVSACFQREEIVSKNNLFQQKAFQISAVYPAVQIQLKSKAVNQPV